jgi:hypothetical protein
MTTERIEGFVRGFVLESALEVGQSVVVRVIQIGGLGFGLLGWRRRRGEEGKERRRKE